MPQINSQLPFFLTLATTYNQAYATTEVWADKIVTDLPSKGAATAIGWMDKLPAMREWLGPRIIHTPAVRDRFIVNKLFELTVGIKQTDIDDDNLGIYIPITANLADQAKKWKDRLVAAKILENPVGFDGVPFVSASHPVNLDNASMGTYSNLTTGATSVEDGFKKGRTAMATRRGADGKVLAVKPNWLLHPPSLFEEVEMLLHSTTTSHRSGGTGAVDAASVFNPWYNACQAIEVPELERTQEEIDGGVKQRFWLLDTSKGISPLVFSVRDNPTMAQMTSAQDMTVFMSNQFVYGVQARGDADVSVPFLFHKVEMA